MKVSIITATFNSSKTIADTIESIISQTYQDIDYWIIDGGSTDNTLEIVKRYEARMGGRLHWVSESDRGIYDAMNKGIRLCSGEVVGILNSDDYLTSPDVIADMVSAFSDDTDAVYGDIHFINDGSPDKCVRYYSSSGFRPSRLRYGYMPAHPSFYVRKSIYDKYGLYSLDYKIASDYDMMVRLFYRYRIKGRYLGKDFVTMRTGGVSTRSFANRMVILREDVRACRAYGLYTNVFLVGLKYFTKVFEFRTLF